MKSMTMNSYQKKIADMIEDRRDRLGRDVSPDTFLLELCGEIGELINANKHALNWKDMADADEGSKRISELYSEIGDVMWYITAYCVVMDIDLSAVLNKNILKLEERYGRT